MEKYLFSDKSGASKTIQKYSLELLELHNKLVQYISKMVEKKGLTKYYESNSDTYDKAIDELNKARALLMSASSHLVGGRGLDIAGII